MAPIASVPFHAIRSDMANHLTRSAESSLILSAALQVLRSVERAIEGGGEWNDLAISWDTNGLDST
eukprot:CAMPEP_0184679834 /NCGR_PEP_ID=MMETSP0312-20130426/2715_1 /TAXON_ID=31354 /ORGANISM="Compsopogon coeruleus, Strain SAG 36.94" /LENGTH=65 /DNA_ID=CAMNT_0027129555 /DNA_START=401 /DNA_END=598 /DNA_ORIENTATION=-